MPELLPEGYIVRAPQPDEVEAVADLIAATDVVAFGAVNFSVEGLASDWDDLDLARNAWVVGRGRADRTRARRLAAAALTF